MKAFIKNKKAPLLYLMVSALCLIIFLIYDRYSHGVRSPYMTYLFILPLTLGFIPADIFSRVPDILKPNRLTYNIYNSGVASLTVSSLLKGVFDIAGNSSKYQQFLMIFAVVMLALGVTCYIASTINSFTKPKLTS